MHSHGHAYRRISAATSKLKSSAISNFHIRDKAIRMLSKTLSIGMPVRNDFISNLMMFNGLIDAIPVSLAMDYRFSSREC